jgi:tRNA modification GTPase
VGRPNVGKSSLLNALLRGDRAIVTAIPGTTRDTLEETINLQGIPIVLVDTAGIRAHTTGEVERIGVERSRTALQRADLALLVIDGSQVLSEADRDIAALIGSKPALVIINKCDLPYPGEKEGTKQVDLAAGILPHASCLCLSALSGQGIEAMEQALVDLVMEGKVITADTPLVSNPRHKASLQQALDFVEAARMGHQNGHSLDLVAIDVREAVDMLGDITGETAGDDLLDSIFSKFCIGK